MFGMTRRRKPDHVTLTVPRVIAELVAGPEPEAVPEARLIDIDQWLRDWRAHPALEPETWSVERDRVAAASRLRFLRWAVRQGRIGRGDDVKAARP